MVDQVLYMWVRNANNDGTGEQSHLGWSTDRGRHWQWADWKWEPFGFPNFIDFGRNYAAAPADLERYVFVYSPDTPSAYNFGDHVILMRVPRDQIRVKPAYEFFAGNDAEGQPTWSPDMDRRRPVFIYPGGCNRMSVTYNAPLQRYLLTMRSGARQRGPTRRPEDQKRHHFGIYDAPQPWGPWTTVYWTDHFEDSPLSATDAQRHRGAAGSWGESQRIPSKWISLVAPSKSRLDINRHSDPRQLRQVLSVPVRQPEAAVGLGPAHLFRAGGAVNAIAWFVQADPSDADGIVGTGRQDQPGVQLPRLGGFRKYVRVEGVVRVRGDDSNAQFAEGPFLDPLRDAAWEVREQVGLGVERLQDFAGQADGDESGLGTIVGIGNLRQADNGACGDVRPVDGGVKAAQQVRVGVTFLGDELKNGLVLERGLLGFAEPSGA